MNLQPMVVDLETQTHHWYGTKSSPHNPDNYIVEAGWCHGNGEVQSVYFNNREECSNSTWFEDALEKTSVLVAHNLTFELHWFMKFYPQALFKFLKRGGQLYCTQYAEYILSNQTHEYPSLEDTALKYGGTKKIDEVKLLWEKGVLTSDIDKALLHKYLTDPVLGDIANTRRVCFSQLPLLRERGVYELFKLRMDSLLFNAIATFNGLYINTEIAYKNLADQEADIKSIQAEVSKQLPELPEDFEFSWTSGYHLSAFLFGGKVAYKAKVSYEPKKYEQVDAHEYTALDDGCGSKYYVPVDDINAPVNTRYATDAYACTVYKSGKNKGLPKTFKIDSNVEKLKWGDKYVTFKGLIDINELPEVIRTNLEGKGDWVGKNTQVDGTPVYSTKDEVLQALARFTDVAKPLSKLKTLEKDTGTYYLRTDDKGKQKGMLQFVEPNNIIHHSLNGCATITGRLSASQPNLQNLPRGDKDADGNATSRVKEMFTSRFGDQGKIIEVDYSALEVVALASISGDKNLLDQLIAGTDMHCYRLAGSLNEPYEDVWEKCHNKANLAHAVYKQMRTNIKPKAFSAQYGASAYGIAYSTGCTVEEAQEFLDTEAKLFPESFAYSKTVVMDAIRETSLQMPVKRELYNNTWKVYREGYFTAKGGVRYQFRQYPKWVRGKGEVYLFKPTQVANYWCQGEASVIVQVACGRVAREFIKRDFFDWKCLLINTVHDAIYADAVDNEVAKEAGLLIKSIMESTPKFMAEVIPAYKDWNYHTTPFPSEAECGSNMANKETIK